MLKQHAIQGQVYRQLKKFEVVKIFHCGSIFCKKTKQPFWNGEITEVCHQKANCGQDINHMIFNLTDGKPRKI